MEDSEIIKVQIVVEVRDDAHGGFVHLASPYPELAPPTIRNILAHSGVGGDEVEMMDRFGVMQRFSLAEFTHLDPDTLLRITVRSASAEREFPPLQPGQVLVKEYLVASPDGQD